MFRELVEDFEKYDSISATVDRLSEDEGTGQLGMEFIFRPVMQMEISRSVTSPTGYLFFDKDSIYFDPSKEEEVAEEDKGDYNQYRLFDPRVLIRGLVPNSEKQEGPDEWTAQYDINNLGLFISPDLMTGIETEPNGFKREFEFRTLDGVLKQMTVMEFGYKAALILDFNYSSPNS